MQLKDTRAIVTGGVSGLGFAVAKHLAAHGGKVALFDVNDEKGAAAVAELGAGNATFLKGLCGIAHGIGLQVLAEGVASDAELAALKALGFDGATGPAVRE